MLKKSVSILLIFSVVGFSNPVFPTYDYTLNTNENSDIESITLDWREFQRLGEELSELRIIKTNCIAYMNADDILITSEKKIDKFEKKNSIKNNARNIVIVTILSLITGFITGRNLNISR